MVSLKKQSFSDPKGKKRYMPGATVFSFDQARQGSLKMDFVTLEQMPTGARFLDIEKRVLEISLVLAEDVQGRDSFTPRLHLRVR